MTARTNWHQETITLSVRVEIAFDPERQSRGDVINRAVQEFTNCGGVYAGEYTLRGRTAYYEQAAQPHDRTAAESA
jgi:hypothetical protein